MKATTTASASFPAEGAVRFGTGTIHKLDPRGGSVAAAARAPLPVLRAEDEELAARFLPILPFGFSADAHDGCSLEGWSADLCRHRGGEGKVRRVFDFQAAALAVELTSTLGMDKASLSFPDQAADRGAIIGCALPVLVVHLKNMGRHCGLEVVVEDDEGRERTVRATNAQSVVRSSAERASVPLRLVDGWNTVALDLESLVARLFGARYGHACRVRVSGNVRLLKAYFCVRQLPRRELPEVLRVPDQQGGGE